MAVGGITSMTVIRVRQISTSILQKISRRMLKIDFIQRNQKALILCIVIWLAVIIISFLSYGATVSSTKDMFYQRGVKAALDMATESGPFVLEKDILALNVAINEFENLEDLHALAVIDHNDIVLSHTDPEMMNQIFIDPETLEEISTIEDVKVTREISSDKIQIVGFWKEITFAGVGIGKVYLSISASNLERSLSVMNKLYISGIILITIALAFVLFFIDRSAKIKAEKIRQDLESSDRIGPYILQKKLAQGGMAELFIADYMRQDGFRKRVALKRILPNLAENEDFVQMFSREARLAALLDHPNVVQIFDFGKLSNAYFIAMEYVEGKNLGEILSSLKQGLSIEQAVFIISEICKGLGYSHTKKDDETGEPLNIVHRDVSPQNMLISYQGEAKISDFGISKAKSDPSLTQAGVIKGKLAYMSVEQTLGKPVDARADIYALGLVLYETITGERIYSFSNDVEAIRKIPKMEIQPLIEVKPGVPEELSRIVMKCLEKDLDQRYQTASELNNDLSTFRKDYKINFDNSDLSDFMKKNFPKQS